VFDFTLEVKATYGQADMVPVELWRTIEESSGSREMNASATKVWEGSIDLSQKSGVIVVNSDPTSFCEEK